MTSSAATAPIAPGIIRRGERPIAGIAFGFIMRRAAKITGTPTTLPSAGRNGVHACRIAHLPHWVGPELWAVMGNDDGLIRDLLAAGEAEGEPGWQLPLWKSYRRQIESTVPKDLLDGGCLLCSEDQPHHCHRRLVAEYLKAKWGSVEIRHLV